MIGRIHERTIFRRLRREGSTVRVGPLWCSVLLDSTLTQPHVAYALGRATGPAVVRNRLRRQLRAVMADVDRTSEVSPGWYLVGADAAAVSLSFFELSTRVPDLLNRAVTKHTTRLNQGPR